MTNQSSSGQPHIGNQAMLRLLAQQSRLSRKCAHCEEEEGKDAVNRAAKGTRSLPAIPSVVHGVLSSTGRPLDRATRSYFEPRFGRDLSSVRIHTGTLAAESATAVDALAYAVGSHLVFGTNQYSPDTQDGRKLLAHELSHVVQQSQSSPSNRASGISNPGDPLELDAERRASQALSSHPSPMSPVPYATLTTNLQRYPVPSSLKCSEVADWLASNSPYAPEWAETACNYSFDGQLDVIPPSKSGGKVSLTAKGNPGLSVGGDCPTDLPEWSPSARPGQAAQIKAWQDMIAVLDAHEGRHRAIGATWRTTLEGKFKATNKTATGTDQADATANLQQALADMQQKWKADAQSAQSKIDPFRGAHLECPAETNAPAATPKIDAPIQTPPK
jgi:Domain of unknown function (DUF4157)